MGPGRGPRAAGDRRPSGPAAARSGPVAAQGCRGDRAGAAEEEMAGRGSGMGPRRRGLPRPGAGREGGREAGPGRGRAGPGGAGPGPGGEPGQGVSALPAAGAAGGALCGPGGGRAGRPAAPGLAEAAGGAGPGVRALL